MHPGGPFPESIHLTLPDPIATSHLLTSLSWLLCPTALACLATESSNSKKEQQNKVAPETAGGLPAGAWALVNSSNAYSWHQPCLPLATP